MPLAHNIIRHITPFSMFKNAIKDVYFNSSKISETLITRYYELGLRPGNRNALISRVQQSHKCKIERLHEINQKTLIQWGKYDNWVPVENAQEFKSLIPNSKVILYEAGHVAMEELPNETVNDAIEFLSA